MQRKIQLILFLFLLPFIVYSQPQGRLNTGLIRALKQEPLSARMISILVKGDPSLVASQCRSLGGTFKYSVENISSITIPLKQIPAFAHHEGIEQVEGLYGAGQLMDEMTFLNANVTPVQQGYAPLTQAYEGEGVVMAVLDDGIDITHPDFKNSDGTTRVKYLWDQTMTTGGTTPQPYDYGQEWDAAAINAGQCTHVEPSYNFGHGSNVTGIATSNGSAVNNFYGVAPACDIITVAVDMGENFLLNVVDATAYSFEKAAAMGKPCVINASIGTYFGSHDGFDLAAQLIDDLITSSNGRAFVCAGGNGGNYAFHLGYNIQQDSSFTWFYYNAALHEVFYEFWIDKDDAAGFNFALGADITSPFTFLARTPYYNILNDFNLNSGFGTLTDTLWDGTTRLGIITINVYEEDSAFGCDVFINPDLTTYYWRFITNGSGHFDLWSHSAVTGTSDMITTNLPSSSIFPDIDRYKLPDNQQSIVSSFSCSDKVITVANYTNRTEYISYYGNLIISTTDTTGALAISSSYGPTRDGRIKPDVAAPGNRTLTTGWLTQMNAFILTQPYKVALGGMHNVNGGTSMASPVVAGIAALYLQKNPAASWKEVKDAILLTAKEDDFTGYDLPDPKWGYGKVDAFDAMVIDISYGCTDPFSINYDPDATIDDGSCEPIVFGCTDPDALNYDPDANMNDGSCNYDVGIEQESFSASFVSCSPNPFHNYTMFNFHLPGEKNAIITISDLSGRIIDKIPVRATEQFFTYRKHLVPGLYFYSIEADDTNNSPKKLVAY